MPAQAGAPQVAPQQAQPEIDPSGQAPAPEAASGEAPQIPPGLVKVPAIQGLLTGAPPAISARISQFKDSDVGKEIAENKDALLAAGFAFYRSIHGDMAVMYNRFHIHGEDIKAADKAGKLQVIAPPFDQVNHALAKDPSHLKNAKAMPAGFASATPQAAPQQASTPQDDSSAQAPVSGPSQALQKRLLAARLTNSQAGAPTSGPAPGGGRLLNSILKQVV
jgi:hypothetical protein